MKDKNVSFVLRSFLSVLLILAMLFSMSAFVFAEPADGANATGTSDSATTGADGVSVVGFHRDGRYVDYYAQYKDYDKAMPEILVSADQFTAATAPHTVEAEFKGRDQVFLRFLRIGRSPDDPDDLFNMIQRF